MGGVYGMYGGRREMHTWFWWGNLKEKDQFKYRGKKGRIILKCILKKYNGSVGAGFIWLRIGTSHGLLRTQQCNFRFHEQQ
jgi:hypothetical protein